MLTRPRTALSFFAVFQTVFYQFVNILVETFHDIDFHRFTFKSLGYELAKIFGIGGSTFECC